MPSLLYVGVRHAKLLVAKVRDTLRNVDLHILMPKFHNCFQTFAEYRTSREMFIV